MNAPLTDVHDPFDPNSPAADLQQGSIETCEMLPPVPIIMSQSADLPDDPDELETQDNGALADAATEMMNEDIDRTVCLEPVQEEQRKLQAGES